MAKIIVMDLGIQQRFKSLLNDCLQITSEDNTASNSARARGDGFNLSVGRLR